MFFEKGGKGKRGTHYYNIEGKEERRNEGKKTRRTKRERAGYGQTEKGKTKLSQGILLFSETPVRNQAKT